MACVGRTSVEAYAPFAHIDDYDDEEEDNEHEEDGEWEEEGS